MNSKCPIKSDAEIMEMILTEGQKSCDKWAPTYDGEWARGYVWETVWEMCEECSWRIDDEQE